MQANQAPEQLLSQARNALKLGGLLLAQQSLRLAGSVLPELPPLFPALRSGQRVSGASRKKQIPSSQSVVS